jgi:hypothetical protein
VEDVGAVLDQGLLRAHDVTGLIDPEATRTLRDAECRWRTPHPEFYDWVFERIRPTFISTRGFWNAIPAYEDDPRFHRDYAAIEAYADDLVRRRYGRVLHSGDYVRRDALSAAGDLDRLRTGYRPAPRPPVPAWRWTDAWESWRHGAPSVAGLRMQARLVAAEGRDLDRAAWLFGRVLEREPDDDVALLGLARSLDRAGRAYEARPVWARLAERERGKGAAADTAMLSRILVRLDRAPRAGRLFGAGRPLPESRLQSPASISTP